MTGHGRGQHERDGARATVELRSVNRKQSEIVVRPPDGLEALEPAIRRVLARTAARGRVEASVTLRDFGGHAKVRLRRDVARAYAGELRQMADELGLKDSVTLSLLIRCPGVVETDPANLDADLAWSLIEPALEAAASDWNGMREFEGQALAADLRGRLELLRGGLGRVGARAPHSVARAREQLLQRLRVAGWETAAETDERIARELLLWAERSDIAEELARLESHFSQVEQCLTAADPMGRKLDFLAQEMGREINTVGSKANDSEISAEVVNLKTELERFREQAQNVE